MGHPSFVTRRERQVCEKSRLEESPGHLLRYVSRFFLQRFPWHGGILFCAGSHGDREDLVSNNANDPLTIALAFAVHSTGHCFIPDGAQRRHGRATTSL